MKTKKKARPHRREELKLRADGHRHIAGVDEAGRGCWAGPIVAGAVILSEDFEPQLVNDSKALTPKQREKMFVHITRHAIAWSVGVVSSQEIDRVGIQKANIQAMHDALQKLRVYPDAVLVDAMPIRFGRRPVKAIIDGDAKVLSIAAASIVAKVVRDALMDGEHRLYPLYGFNVHKGYGTPQHAAALKKHGPTDIHRRSFTPVAAHVQRMGKSGRVASRRRKI